MARTMAGAAHNPSFAKKMGIPKSVAREFNQADKGTGILKGKKKKQHQKVRHRGKTFKIRK